MRTLKDIIETKYNYKINKKIFRITFIFMALYCLLSLQASGVDLKNMNNTYDIKCTNKTAMSPNSLIEPYYCINPFYNQYDNSTTEIIFIGECINNKGQKVECNNFNMLYINTFFVAMLGILGVGFIINDFYNKKVLK